MCNSTIIVSFSNGKIAAIGTDDEIRGQYQNATFETVIDATGKSIIPGKLGIKPCT